MLNHTFTVTAISVSTRGIVRAVDMTKLSPEIINLVFEYGLRQKLADAAASALANAFEEHNPAHGLHGDALKSKRKEWGEANESLVLDHATTMLEAAIDKLYAGDWTARGESVTADPLDKYRQAVVRDIIAKDKQSAAWKAYNAIDSTDQKARKKYLLELAAQRPETIDAMAQARRDAEKVEKIAFSL